MKDIPIRDCRWSEPFCQDDMSVAYRCKHQTALDEIASDSEFVDCWCLGFVDLCPYFENLKTKKAG